MAERSNQQLKLLMREALLAAIHENFDALYSTYLKNISELQTRVAKGETLAPSDLKALSFRGKRTVSNKRGLETVYKRFKDGISLTTLTRSETAYATEALSCQNPWKKAIQTLLMLEAVQRRYHNAPVNMSEYPGIFQSINTLTKSVEALLRYPEDDLSFTNKCTAINQQIDAIILSLNKQICTYYEDCRKVSKYQWSLSRPPQDTLAATTTVEPPEDKPSDPEPQQDNWSEERLRRSQDKAKRLGL